MRALRSRFAGAITGFVVVGLAAAGCTGDAEPDPMGKAFGQQVAREMNTRGQAGAAVEDLRKDPVVGYDGALPGSATTGDVKMTVGRSGAAQGSVDLDGKSVDVYEADGTTLVKSGKSYWDKQAGGSRKAEQYAGKWVKVGTGDNVGFDAAELLKPESIAQRLRGRLSWVGTPVKDKVGDDEALKIPVIGGDLYVTAKAPNRLLKIDVPSLLSSGGQGPASGKGLELTHLDPKAVDQFYDDLKGEDLSDTRDTSVNFIQQGTGKLDCKTGGSCSASLPFRTSTTDSGRDKVPAVLNVSMTASGLPTKKCSATKSVPASGSSSMSCKANFKLAPSPHPKTYRVRAKYVLTAKASIDQDKINKTLDDAKKKDHDAAKKNE